jgi:lysophospholipase L1-like esterase
MEPSSLWNADERQIDAGHDTPVWRWETPMWRNLLLSLVSLFLALLGLEVWCRLHPSASEVQTNNEYAFRTRIGHMQFGVPYHSWLEIYPADMDGRGYYRRSDYRVGFHFNQLGARWLEPADEKIDGRVLVVLGDSFTYGSALRYEDTWVYRLEALLRRDGHRVTLLNFGHSGADSQKCLEVYRGMKDRVPHTDVLYALNLNDLISFDTSYVIRNQALALPLVERSALATFALHRINYTLGRRLKIAYLTSPAVFEKPTFRSNLRAIVNLRDAAASAGASFQIALLPILIDLRADTFRPVYEEIVRRLGQFGVPTFDLSTSVRGRRDEDLWVLPVDQHPNEVASALLAERLHELLESSGAPVVLPEP